MDTASLRSLARRRALRAAQIASLAFSLAGGGCGGTAVMDIDGGVATDMGHGGGDGGGTDLGAVADLGGGTDAGGSDAGGSDAGGADSGGSDGGVTVADLGNVDAEVPDLGPYDPCMDPVAPCDPVADGKCGVTCTFSTDPDCCTCIGGFPSGGGCAIAGPFVPPVMA
jgi:hypothetical protein